MQQLPAQFEDHAIRRVYGETSETWWFSVVDIVQVLTRQPDYQAARNYWKVLKNRLAKEGSESVTKCNRLKLTAADGKNYVSDVATAETLLRLVQSVPARRPSRSSFGWPGSATSACRNWPTRRWRWIAPARRGRSTAAAKSGSTNAWRSLRGENNGASIKHRSP